MGKTYQTTQSKFFCVECANEGIPVQRKKGQERERGHLKKLYCLHCGKEVNHAEVRERGGYTEEDFFQEFNLGRFVNGNRVPINELLSCSCENCSFNVDGKCWNANNSYSCKYKPIKGDEEKCLN